MAGSGSPGTFGPSAAPAQGGGDNAMIEQFIQMLSGGMGGGGFGGTNPMMPSGGLPIGMDALGIGAGGDPLGMGNLLAGGGIGLNPAQAAGLRLTRSNQMNALRQSMANQHRSIGAAGGRDFSRHVQNIDDEMMALSEQKVQDNIKNALAYNDQLMRYSQQNLAQNSALAKLLGEAGANLFRYGGADTDTASPGTFSGSEGGA